MGARPPLADVVQHGIPACRLDPEGSGVPSARPWAKDRSRRRKMRFDVARDPAKTARIQRRLADRNQQLMISRGALVRYEMPALPNPFPQLSRVLDRSAHQAQFRGVHYHIRSRDGMIEQL